MTPPDAAFSRVILGSVVAFAVLAVVYFRVPEERRRAIVGRPVTILLATVGVVSVSAAITSELSLVGRVCLSLLGGLSVLGSGVLLLAARMKGPTSVTRPKT